MPSPQPNLLARDDTFFGVCQGLGEDLGFNPLYLRIVFAILVLVNPLAAVGGYVGAGALVLLSRLIFPNPRPASAPRRAAASAMVVPPPAAEHKPLTGDNNAEPDELSVAA
jgi:phage shock protein C